MTEALRELTDRWGLGISQIARALHTSPAVLRHWRNGVGPNDRMKTAVRLGVSHQHVSCRLAVFIGLKTLLRPPLTTALGPFNNQGRASGCRK